MLWMSCSHLKFSMCKLSPSFPTLHKSGPPFVFSLIIALFGFQITNLQIVLDFALYPQNLPDTWTSSLFVEYIPPSLLRAPSICNLKVIITTSVISILGYKKWTLIPAMISRSLLRGSSHRHRKVVHTSSENASGDAVRTYPKIAW